MLLATHTVIGTALARVFPGNPVWAFAVSLAAHYAADRVPHWNPKYEQAVEFDPADPTHKKLRGLAPALKGIALATTELAVGLIISWYFFVRGGNMKPAVFLLAIAGSILPDVMQFFHLLWKNKFMDLVGRWHDWAHISREKEIKDPAVGIVYQALIIFLFVVIGIIL